MLPILKFNKLTTCGVVWKEQLAINRTAVYGRDIIGFQQIIAIAG
jgi:hypothetical protein